MCYILTVPVSVSEDLNHQEFKLLCISVNECPNEEAHHISVSALISSSLMLYYYTYLLLIRMIVYSDFIYGLQSAL